MRILEKQAVKDGGGTNHRYCLSDMVMIKDNHIDAVGSITQAVALAKEKTKGVQIEVEVETFEQFLEALNTECDIIMLDNMSNELMLKCVLKNNHHTRQWWCMPLIPALRRQMQMNLIELQTRQIK